MARKLTDEQQIDRVFAALHDRAVALVDTVRALDRDAAVVAVIRALADVRHAAVDDAIADIEQRLTTGSWS